MPPTDIIALGGVTLFGLSILGAGLALIVIGASRVRLARTLREAGPIPLREVPDSSDFVEFEGTARTNEEETLEAPISGVSCLGYTVSVRSRNEYDDENWDEADATWQLEGQASASVPFAVDDGPDRVEVDPTDAVLSLDEWDPDGTTWIDHTELTDDSLNRLAAAGVPGTDTPVGTDQHSRRTTRRQYLERRLEPGAEVHVFGGSVTDGSTRTAGSGAAVTVAGDTWFEITSGSRSTVIPDQHRSGSLYVIFGGLLAIPGVGFTLAGLVGLVSTLLL